MSSTEIPFDSLDPASPDQTDLIRRALLESWEEPGMEAFCQRVVEQSPDDVLREEAKVALGRYAYMRLDYDAARRLCREALTALWGTETRGELAACINLAMICLLDQRLFEALVLSRQGVELAAASENPLAISKANLHLAGVLRSVGDTRRARIALERAAEVVDGLDDASQANQLANIAEERVQLALVEGDIHAALRHMATSEEVAGEGDITIRDRTLRGAVLVAAGRAAEAFELLGTCAPEDGDKDPTRAWRARLEAECTAALKGREAGLWSARSLLDWLEREGVDQLAPGTRLYEAERLGVFLLDECRSPQDARRAYEVAATAALERIRELGAFVQELPDLGRATDEDRQILEEYRQRYEQERAILLHSLADLLEVEGPATRLFGEHREDIDAAIKVCAWCQKVQGPDGIWFMPSQALLPTGRLYVTHGICEVCFCQQTGDELMA